MRLYLLLILVFTPIFLSAQVKLLKELKQQFIYFPSGADKIGKDTLTFRAFYLKNREVTNAEYREFISYLKVQNDTAKLKYYLIDSAKWNDILKLNNPYAAHYHSHEEYNDYPVVNISYEATLAYCDWLTNVKYTNVVEGYNVIFSLPIREEWIRAAQYGNRFKSYAWDNYGLRYFGKKKKHHYQFRANFKRIGDESIHFNQESEVYELIYEGWWDSEAFNETSVIIDAAIVAPSKSYWPTEKGLYNMNGNAAEMVIEKGIAVGGSWNSPGYDIRNHSFINYSSPQPTVGFRPVMRLIKID